MILKTELTKEEIARLMMLCGALRDLSEATVGKPIAYIHNISAQLGTIQKKIEKIILFDPNN